MEKLLYLHIPKTGGVAFRSIIENSVCSEKILHITSPADLPTKAGQKKFDFIHGHLNIRKTKNITDHKLITSLRNPIDRCISAYSFWRSLNPNDAAIDPNGLMKIRKAQELSLDEFISTREPLIISELSNLQTRLLSGAKKAELHLDATHLEKAINTLKSAALFALNSRLDESIDMLCYKFGFFRPSTMQKINTSIHPKIISPESTKALHELNHLDLRLLEWAENNFNRQHI